jgi:hypothetical protein
VLANAILGLASEERANLDFLDAGLDDGLRLSVIDHGVGLDDDFARGRIHDVVHREAAREAIFEFDNDGVASRIPDLADLEAVVAMAILFADDDVLSDVDETAGEIARVCGLKRGIRATLTGAVGVDEEFGHLHTFTVGGDDRKFDRFVLRVHDAALHAHELLEVIKRATGARVGHLNERVELVFLEDASHLILDLVGDFGPGIDDHPVPFGIGEHAFMEDLFDFVDFFLTFLDDRGLVGDGVDVGDRHGDGRDGRILEALVLDLIEDGGSLRRGEFGRGRIAHIVLVEDHVDDRSELLLLDRRLERERGDVGFEDIAVLADLIRLGPRFDVGVRNEPALDRLLIGFRVIVDVDEIIREDLVEDDLADRGDEVFVLHVEAVSESLVRSSPNVLWMFVARIAMRL